MMTDNIFLKIAEKKIPAKIVYEDARCVAFHDVNPQAPVHVLIVPKKVIPRLTAATEADRAILGKLLLVLGIVIALLGAVLLFSGKLHLPFGRLPGDIYYRGRNTTFYFPLATSILLSIVLSLILWLIGKTRH